ncbi:penicillin-binding protein [Bacillus toyonensis]|uniref:penicillin-binding protein n=1 Tax=Bacillus toyonensis TaxID=155322 RepID=UPI001908E40D|nr:penicillin-binding protein [Bacillus toyonensis]QQN85632.1 penicillin-binding protein [Bacillus toyonensis]
MAQLTFLPKIDRKATQARLEEVLENVRIYRQFGMIRHEMKVTASSEVRYHGPTNMVGKPAEDITLANVGMSGRTYRRNKSRGIATIFENPHAKSIQKFIQLLANSVTKENPKT